MTPHLTDALARQRIADLRRAAAADRLAALAAAADGTVAGGTLAGGTLRRAGRLIRSLGGRRYQQIELVWPDGVRSVIPAAKRLNPNDRDPLADGVLPAGLPAEVAVD